MKKTPMYEDHVKLQGKMVDFGGWALPIQYEHLGIKKEHLQVRSNAGLFDVSHMGEVWITGEEAASFLYHLVTNDTSLIKDGQVQYNIMCYPEGGAVDDLLVYKCSDTRFFLVINAANVDKDVAWIQEQAKGKKVTVHHASSEYAEVALQGPEAEKILQKLVAEDVAKLPFFHFHEKVALGGMEALISRTGYTGEDGFEIYVPWDQGSRLWNMVMEAGEEEGLIPTGLGARDSLRFEACLPLYGHEISREITPLEGGLGFFVKLDKKGFIGQEPLRKSKETGRYRRSMALEMVEKGVPREGYPVQLTNGDTLGYVTTGGYSPTLEKNIALALVSPEAAEEEGPFYIDIRGKKKEARRVKKPFYKKRYKA